VARRGDLVVFVEVKTRRPGPQEPQDALTAAQRRRIRRAAERWIHAHPTIGREFRFDLVAVDVRGSAKPCVRHVEAAFWGDEAL